jgi:hypothetical protein
MSYTRREFRAGARPTGCYSLEDFQLALPEYEANSTINILEALGLCIKVHIELDNWPLPYRPHGMAGGHICANHGAIV